MSGTGWSRFGSPGASIDPGSWHEGADHGSWRAGADQGSRGAGTDPGGWREGANRGSRGAGTDPGGWREGAQPGAAVECAKPVPSAASGGDERLLDFIAAHPRLFVLTGAGCSTDSGIPDYRDENGEWKRVARPVMYQAFVGDLHTRRRYWARSLVGWQRFGRARPNDAHRALARLEQQGQTEALVTQNVDGLHQAAGSTGVIDLHGRLDQIRCLGCEQRSDRQALQRRLLELNPSWARLDAPDAPDGDADLEGRDFSDFEIPACESCAGLLKPDVVFFGESVPPSRVAAAMEAVERCDAVLVVGSSLMVYSGYRFALAAHKARKPIAAINLGRTRADDLLTLKVNQPCVAALAFLLDEVADRPAS